MLHTQPSRINNTNLIDFKNTKIWLLETSRIRSVRKAPPLSNPSNREDVVKSTVEDLKSLLKCRTLGFPIRYVDFGGPDPLVVVFVEGFGKIFEAF
jgi:hypothetical protein